MTERIEHARASILHQRPYRESSLLLEIFSREHGRLGLVANGARRPKSRLRAVLQPMQEASLSWTLRGDLGSLRQAEPLVGSLNLGSDALYAGLYMNELLLRLCVRSDPHPELYDAYRQSLHALQQDLPPGQVLRIFERDLLEAIGYGLELAMEAENGKPIDPAQRYSFDSQRGATPAAQAAGNAVTVPGAALLALHHGELVDPDLCVQAKRILQPAIHRLLDNRPLRTVQMMRQLRRSSANTAKEQG